MPEKSIAQIRLDMGAKYPFDATDSWWDLDDAEDHPLPAIDWAHAAARGVISDLMDRHTIKHGFNNVDEAVREEIIRSIAEIIRLANQKGPPL